MALETLGSPQEGFLLILLMFIIADMIWVGEVVMYIRIHSTPLTLTIRIYYYTIIYSPFMPRVNVHYTTVPTTQTSSSRPNTTYTRQRRRVSQTVYIYGRHLSMVALTPTRSSYPHGTVFFVSATSSHPLFQSIFILFIPRITLGCLSWPACVVLRLRKTVSSLTFCNPQTSSAIIDSYPTPLSPSPVHGKDR